jgi:hypothetical protein
MECSTARSWLFRSLDDELSAAEEEGLSLHLAGCPACAREKKLLGIPRRIGRALPILQPSPYFYARLKARLEKEDQSITIWQIILGLSRHLVPALAAVTLALLSVFVYFQIQGPEVDVSQAYDQIFFGDRPERMVIADQGEITDESVLRAIAEEEATRHPPVQPDPARK